MITINTLDIVGVITALILIFVMIFLLAIFIRFITKGNEELSDYFEV